MPFSIGRPKLLRCSYTSKTKRKTFARKSNTRRNISILATLIVVVVIVVALSGALSSHPTYTMFVHVYDDHYHPQTIANLTEAMLIQNVTVTVAGVSEPTRTTPTGIIAYDQLPEGTYQITVAGNATVSTPYLYRVGPNCPDRTPDDGSCHALVPATGPLHTASLAPLPSYLDRCVTSSLLYHAHVSLSIIINGSSFPIPAGLGIQGSCIKPIHTHDSSGTIHIETDDNRIYTLHDFFLVWGNWENNQERAIFNSTQIFGAHAGNGHILTFTVNGNTDSSFQNYQIPENAQASQVGGCPPSPCQIIDIVVMYS